MPTTEESLNEFATMAWQQRASILRKSTAYKGTKAVYNLYNFYTRKETASWRGFLMTARDAFGGTASQIPFKFQGWQASYTGAQLAEAVDQIFKDIVPEERGVLEMTQDVDTAHRSQVRNAGIARIGKALQKGKKAIRADLKADRIDDVEADRRWKALYAEYKEQVGEAEQNALEEDPILVLKKFVWTYGMAPKGSSKFRIYVSPKVDQSVPVFCDIAAYMHGKFRVPGMDPMQFPGSGKVGTPGPRVNAETGRVELTDRTDRIVLYCETEDQMKGGVAWLRHYQAQAGKKARFQPEMPRGTKIVEDLVGVSITVQPQASATVMKRAGIDKVKGMSFGMSRSAVIYLALQHADQNDLDFRGFQSAIDSYARKARLNLQLTNLPEV